ncbi:Protein NIM1-INTERACTING [Trema orientale]|uniref:Protein NIM1-INTERACTING n=1 Tax=Trema orientale TaxID=63057 RepID=A0A2P5FDR1_TREOI|nr:Protein NIM1-INTERACTING [Trema orientale]
MSDGRGAEAVKRKPPGENDAVSGRKKKKKAREDEEITETTEDEVEEFFAILKRIHVAIGYFKKGAGGNGRQLTEQGSRLRAMLETENYDGVSDEAMRREEEGVEENLGFDLNAKPGPDCDRV